MTLPPIPDWQAVHPLVVHFPIALLLIAPLFVVMGAVQKPGRGYRFLLAALILMAVGTISTFIAASSGEAAGELAERVPQAKAVLDQHQELAETTEIAFSALTFIFASIVFVPKLLKRNRSRMLSTVLPLVFLVLYATGAVSLANTAHQGGRLVHELGIKAPIHPSAPH
jgi:uncharacterized membrane protein